jgi:prophage antirepressor-like protein
MTEPDSHSTPRVALFQERELRRTFVEDQWWFVVEDVVLALIDSRDPKQYIQRMKQRDPELGKGWVQIVRTLPIATPGGTQNLNCSNTQGLFRLIQSIPSPKAEPFKRWLAKVGKERLDEIENPELAMGRMQDLYEKKGYPKEWIDKRLRGIAVRQDLTDEWKQRGVTNSEEFAILTNEIMHGTFALKVDEYKQVKALVRENLRDHMTDIELILTMLAEATTTKLHRDRDSVGMAPLKKDAKDGGAVAGRTRKDIEKQSGQPVISSANFKQLAFKKAKKIKGSES